MKPENLKTHIAVIVPTIRLESLEKFRAAWDPLFRKHRVELFEVFDGKKVKVRHTNFAAPVIREKTLLEADILPVGRSSGGALTKPEEKHGRRRSARPTRFIFNFNDGVRNLGFLAARSFAPAANVYLTLDDDVFPIRGRAVTPCRPDQEQSQGAAGAAPHQGDPIADHLAALEMRVPISWFSTASRYMRGFPYAVREEAPVWVSHGVWQGVHDYDGPSQLVNGNPPAEFYRGPIPRGCLTPVCGMNLAFRVEALPWMYFAPMGKALGVQRFADIWMGIRLKRALDQMGKAIVSGYSTVWHSRASNVLANLEQEARGIRINEEAWRGSSTSDFCPEHPDLKDYAKLYDAAFVEWKIVCLAMEANE